MLPAINIVKILTINVLFISVDYFLGNTILVVKGFYKEFNKSVIYTGLFYLCIIGILFLSNVHNIYVFAFVSIAVELFCLGYRWTVIKKNSLFATNWNMHFIERLASKFVNNKIAIILFRPLYRFFYRDRIISKKRKYFLKNSSPLMKNFNLAFQQLHISFWLALGTL